MSQITLADAGLDASRLARFTAAEREQFIAANPRSQALAERTARHWLMGSPLHWMNDWSTPFALHVAQASGAHVTDVDG
ncbi:MAG: aspartate aminotransferase family protein, partial [Pseudomonadota bacterium]|nr:aspartate aminotransferase family protein [Pseudomonadota bacterium]